jgi:hypothetical protein
MTIAQTDASTPRQPLRLWPGVVLVILQWLVKLGAPIVAPDAGGNAFLAGLALAALVLVWWLFFSRVGG